MDINIPSELNTILEYARDEAMRTGHRAIGTDHLMLGILRDGDNGAVIALRLCGIDTDAFKTLLDKRLFREKAIPWAEMSCVGMAVDAKSTMNIAALETLRDEKSSIEPIHLLTAILSADGSISKEFLAGNGISRASIRKAASGIPTILTTNNNKKPS